MSCFIYVQGYEDTSKYDAVRLCVLWYTFSIYPTKYTYLFALRYQLLVDSGNLYFLYVIGRESFGYYIMIIQFIATERRTYTCTSVSNVIIATNNDLSTARYQIISFFISDTLLLSKKVSEIWIKIQHFYTCRYVSDHTKWILECRLHNVGHSVSPPMGCW